MAVFRSIQTMNANQKRRHSAVVRSLHIEHDELTEEMRAAALELVSGILVGGQKELDLAGNPYGRRRGRIFNKRRTRRRAPGMRPYPLLPIHEQSGRLKRSLRIIRRKSQGVSSKYLWFTASYAKFILAVGGTDLMVDRGFWKELRRRYNRAKRRLLTAKRQAERQ